MQSFSHVQIAHYALQGLNAKVSKKKNKSHMENQHGMNFNHFIQYELLQSHFKKIYLKGEACPLINM